MAETQPEQKLPTDSTISWIQVDEKNGKSASSGEESPQPSETNEEAMTDQLADASRSLYNSTLKGDADTETKPAGEAATTETKSCGSNALCYSTLFVTHALAILVGIFIGRKVQSR